MRRHSNPGGDLRGGVAPLAMRFAARFKMSALLGVTGPFLAWAVLVAPGWL